jgi:2,4-dienoyl-CoA reductase-like NADH-dependent reductase (Old Yellow Enzyme family)
MQQLPELFTPLTIGPMTIANRIMMAGMSAGARVDENGDIAASMIAYFLERARHSPGMVAVGAASVRPVAGLRGHSLMGSGGLRLFADDMIPSLRKLVDAVHQTTRSSAFSCSTAAAPSVVSMN